VCVCMYVKSYELKTYFFFSKPYDEWSIFVAGLTRYGVSRPPSSSTRSLTLRRRKSALVWPVGQYNNANRRRIRPPTSNILFIVKLLLLLYSCKTQICVENRPQLLVHVITFKRVKISHILFPSTTASLRL